MDHPHRKFQFGLVALAAVIALGIASVAASAQTLLKPAEGATVREVVRIAVDKASLTDGDYIAVYVDGRFVGASGMVSNTKPPAVYFDWDSKAHLDDPNLTPTERVFKDGPHKLEVGILTSSAMLRDTLKSTFNLENKVSRKPNETYRLSYKFHTGTASGYKVNVDSKLLSSYGSVLSGTSPVQGNYRVLQIVEDGRPDGSALLSYRVDRGGVVRVMGQPYLINGGKAGSTVYKEVNRYGRIIRRNGILQDNVLARKGRRSLPDVLVELNSAPVKIGESWQAVEKEEVSIEGVGDIIQMTSSVTLEELEWQDGQQCARLKTSMTGTGKLLSNDRSLTMPRITGEGIFYVGMKTGKLVKSQITLSTTVDLGPFTPGAAAGIPETTTSSGEDEESGVPMPPSASLPGTPGGTRYGGATPSSGGTSSTSSTGEAATSGTLRVTIQTQL